MYREWLLLHEQSGFGWDEGTRRIYLPEAVWESYLASHKIARWLRNNSLRNTDLCEKLFTSTTANGQAAISIRSISSFAEATPVPEPGASNPNPSLRRPRSDSASTDTNQAKKRRQTASEKQEIAKALVEELQKSNQLKRETIKQREEERGKVKEAIKIFEQDHKEWSSRQRLAGIKLLSKHENASTFLSIEDLEMRDIWLEDMC
jgi:hypothetical protein